MKLLLTLLFCVSAFAGQSLQLVPGRTGTFSDPYQAATSRRVEMWLTGWTVPASDWQTLINTAGMKLEMRSNGQLWMSGINDSSPSGGLGVSLTGRSNVMIRFQRDVAGKLYTAEIVNHDGTGYSGNSTSIGTTDNTTFGGGNIGSSGTTATIAFIRVCSDLVPLNSAPPDVAGSGCTAVSHWKFDGTPADSGPANRPMTIGGATWENPTAGEGIYPAVRAYGLNGSFLTFRAGTAQRIDGAAGTLNLTDSATAQTCFWQQISGPSTLTWSDRTSCTPYISGMVAGEYSVRLVASRDTYRATADASFGAVATDSKGVVVYDDPRWDAIFGPIMAFNTTESATDRHPWTWLDDRNRALADLLGEAQGVEINPIWDTVLGTASVPNGSTSVTISGANAQTVFCGGGTTPESGAMIVFHLTTPTGESGRYAPTVGGCPNATTVTIEQTWNTSTWPAVSNAPFAKSYNTLYHEGGYSFTYYDNALAHRATHFASGRTKYRTYANWLSEMDKGHPNLNYGYWVYGLGSARQWALGGFAARALDRELYEGQTDYYPIMRRFLGQWRWVMNGSGYAVSGEREGGYILGVSALWSRIDEGKAGSISASLRTDMTNYMTNATLGWFPLRWSRGSGNTTQYWWGTYPTSDRPGRVDVQNNNAVITCTSGQTCNFLSSTAVGKSFWTAPPSCGTTGLGGGAVPPACASTVDQVAYRVASIQSNTQITLTTPYQGATNSGRIWQNNIGGDPTGPGNTVFMVGITGRAFWQAKHAFTGFNSTIANDADATARGIYQWLAAKGFDIPNKRIYYVREHPDCEPTPTDSSVASCLGGSTRGYQQEIFGFLSDYYLSTGDASALSAGDTLYEGAWHKPGWSGLATADGSYWGDVDSIAKNGGTGKYFGFCFGYGFCRSWPAARLGGRDPESLRTAFVGFNLASVTGATSARVTVKRPSGASAVVPCASSPCSVSVDARQGAHLLTLEYLSAGAAVLAKGEPLVVQ